ncbi:MAG: hypothetical protein MPW15_08650 [Candidatus Manganitrophus sp.]|nr:hypothetical protein [Candidatus Manganitrophus sp.]
MVFLVRRHLILSEVALYRDFSNEPVLLQFASEVARPETLKKLFVLTCADIRAVGPGTWTSWKGELLLKLYGEALSILAGEESDPEERKVEMIVERLRQEAKGKYPEVWLEETLQGLIPRYLLATPFEKMLADLSALFHLLIDPIHVSARYLPDSGMTEYTLYTYDQITPGLFSKMTGVLAAKGLQIMGAQVFTQSNGMVVDTFRVIDPDYTGPVPPERIETISQEVRSVLIGKETIETLFTRGQRFRSSERTPSDGRRPGGARQRQLPPLHDHRYFCPRPAGTPLCDCENDLRSRSLGPLGQNCHAARPDRRRFLRARPRGEEDHRFGNDPEGEGAAHKRDSEQVFSTGKGEVGSQPSGRNNGNEATHAGPSEMAAGFVVFHGIDRV